MSMVSDDGDYSVAGFPAATARKAVAPLAAENQKLREALGRAVLAGSNLYSELEAHQQNTGIELEADDQAIVDGALKDLEYANAIHFRPEDAALSSPSEVSEPVADNGGGEGGKREALVAYALRHGPRCRDCADEAGVCPYTGIGCGERKKAAEWIVDALIYGAQHGYCPANLVIPSTGDAVREALEQQMDAMTEDFVNLPSSIHREAGRVWLEGWFDIPAALNHGGSQS